MRELTVGMCIGVRFKQTDAHVTQALKMKTAAGHYTRFTVESLVIKYFVKTWVRFYRIAAATWHEALVSAADALAGTNVQPLRPEEGKQPHLHQQSQRNDHTMRQLPTRARSTCAASGSLASDDGSVNSSPREACRCARSCGESGDMKYTTL